MVFQSLLPPVPDLSFPNAHHLVLNRPEQAEWEDYILHVDALTGKTRKWREFKDRVKRGATAFRNPNIFPYEENGIVGILSENCLVGCREMTFRVRVLTGDASGVWARVGVSGACSFAVGRWHPIRSVPGNIDSVRTEGPC